MRTFALIGLMCGCACTVQSQTSTTFDAGFARVHYDGFLPSGAVYVTPTVRWEDPDGRAFVTARGTYLRFESGNRSLDASANASWFTPFTSRWRGELAVAAGASDYADIATFAHGSIESRLHLLEASRGGWLGATVGQASYGGGARSVTVLALGVWAVWSDMTFFSSIDRSLVGDTTYTDLRSSARWTQGGLAFEGVVGARLWSRGAGRGVWGEGSATVTLGRKVAIVVAAGRYPTDVVTGSIAGRYLTASIRLGSVSPRVREVQNRPARVYSGLGSTSGSLARLEILLQPDEQVRLTLHAPVAGAVEIAGDFTDWQAVALTRTVLGTWEGLFRIPRGVHRINVRVNGGPWMVPAGTTRSVDDYDGEVGIFILP